MTFVLKEFIVLNFTYFLYYFITEVHKEDYYLRKADSILVEESTIN